MICFSIKLEQQSGLIFFPECTLREYHVIERVLTECVVLTLFDKISVHTKNNSGIFIRILCP